MKQKDPRDPDNFFHPDPYSIRAICPDWINTRAQSLDPENGVQLALEEVFETLAARVDQNRDHDRSPVVYPPDAPGDPYVMMIPVLRPNKKISDAAPPPLPAPAPSNRVSTVREDFEDLIFEIEPALNKEDLARDEKGVYTNAVVNAHWRGFFMYHLKMTQTSSATFKDVMNKTLGRYVLAKVGKNGVALFNRAPYRFPSFKLAHEAALGLIAEKNEAYGIFRCLDVFGVPTEDYTR